VDQQLTMGDGSEQAGASSTWRSFVPDLVIRTLLDHPGGPPIASTKPTDAVVLFADIVGFTPMSEALARAGSFGTEELTRILNRWFDAMADRIARHGGSVAEFAGDALVAVFRSDCRNPKVTLQRAVQCAIDMQAAMSGFQGYATSAGTFGLAMKVGIAAGPLLLTIMGDPAIRLVHVLAGQALDLAAAAERHACSGETVVDGTLLDDGLGIEVVERRDRWCVVGGLDRHVTQARQPPVEAIDEDMIGQVIPFLHHVIADRLRSGRRELVNEHRKVTVAFVGLPELAADDPGSVATLQRYVAAAVRVLDRYEGNLQQVATGDKGSLLIASFGTPVSHEDDEERAVRCCLELLRLPGGPFRAGVTTGFVYCGEVGSERRRAYAVVGDSVNLAARLMQAAGPGQLLVDRTTNQRVSDTTIQDRLEPVIAKGKAGPIDVWAVHALDDRPRTDWRRAVSTEPLVGREPEAAEVRALAERALAGQGQLVFLTGEPGIGKSRLGVEAVRMAKGLGFAVYGGACRSHGTSTSYLVWRSIWRDLLRLPVSELDAERQLAARIALGDGGSGQRVPLLAPILNFPIPDSELTAVLDPQTRDELLRSLLLDLLRDRAASGPLLFVLEDCHWIDPASQALLEFLARNIADQPVLIVATARATTLSPLGPMPQLAHFAEIRLAELAAEDAERLVAQRLRRRYGRDTTIAPSTVRQVVDRGEGNPFYLEELVSYLHDRGIDPGDPRGLGAFELPDGLQRLVMARIDQLDESERATIKVASVIGRRFRPWWISEAYPAAGPAEEVARHLEHLDELDLTPRHSSEPEYAFRHAITQEVAYQSLTFQMREVLHERVAMLIEESYPDRLAQYVDVLAHHYGRTRRVDKQRYWFRAAGDAAKAAFANEAAVAYYQRLLPLLREDQTGDVLAELGAVWHLTGRWTEAERTYRQAMEVARQADDRSVLAASQRDLGDLLMYTRPFPEAVAWLTRAADEFEQLGDQEGVSRTLDRMTFALYQRGAYDEALTAATRHLAIATKAGDLAGISIALNHTGLVRLHVGETAEALELLQRACDAATKSGNQRCLLHAASNLALAHWRCGNHSQAITVGHQALSVAQEIGHRQIAGVVIGNMGEVYLDQGDNAKATKCFAQSLRIAVELGDWNSVTNRVASLAATAASQGRDREAVRLFSRAIELARSVDAPHFLCYCLHQLAKLHVGRGQLEQAERVNQEALEIANRSKEREVQIPALLLSFRLQVELGRTSTEQVVEQLQTMKDVWVEPHERASLLDALWQNDPTHEWARKQAADLYRGLYDGAPSVEHREVYKRLTGVELPPSPPLPPLPEAIEAEMMDLDGLLQQVDLARRHLGAA
jgi:class 3 adenylate cyclase/tetratricopeptide (TPR) repeat protein